MTRPPPSRTIVRKSLHEELVDHLHAMILGGDLAPGEKVPERALCEQFGVSRTPLREALKIVATDGLVRLEQNRGAWVTEVTVQEIEEVFPVLAALEALAGELACHNITAKELSAIRAVHDRMGLCFRKRDLDGYFRLNQEIHRAIVHAARNPTLATTWQSLSVRVQRARYLANMSDDRWSAAMAEHDSILQLLETRDAQRLGRLLSEHLLAKRDAVLRWLEQEAPGG